MHPFSQFKYEHESGNIIGQWTFSWILSLLFHGYKTPIDVDILEKVTASETSAEHSDNLKRLLTSETSTLFKSCLKMNSYLISMGAFYRFAADVCSLGSALSIKWIVQAMNNGTQVTHQPFIIPKKTWAQKTIYWSQTWEGRFTRLELNSAWFSIYEGQRGDVMSTLLWVTSDF